MTVKQVIYNIPGKKMNKDLLVIHQPNIFPNIKLLQKICIGNEWLILDDVQYVNRELQNRIKIRKFNNIETERWLTAPVIKSNYIQQIKNVEIFDFENFKKNTFNIIYDYYHESIFYEFINDYLENCFSNKTTSLTEFAVNSTLLLLEMLGITMPHDYSSKYEISTSSTQRLIDLCHIKEYKAYLSGLGGKNYLLKRNFKENNIDLYWHPWIKPLGDASNTNWNKISSLDFIARYGPNELKKYITQGEIIYERN